jgi:hypothetical protein
VGSTGTTGTTAAGQWASSTPTLYGDAQGLMEEIVDASADEAKNIWAVSNSALYVMRAGQTSFRRYTDADGLHLANAEPPGIMTVAGGHANEGFVGYNGADITDTQNDPLRTKGKMDHVGLNADGSLAVTHIDIHNDDYVVGNENDFTYNEDRGARRMLYDHSFHPGTLYIGWNHGVTRMDWGHNDPTSGLPYADHVHPVVYNLGGTEMMAEWRALALDPTPREGHAPGVLWMGGEFTAGAIDWTPVLYDWSRNERNPFIEAFGPSDPSLSLSDLPPVFPVAQAADPVNIRGIAITHDGTVWFASGPQWNPPTDAMLGIATWNGAGFNYIDPGSIGLPTREIIDMVAMPDDTLAIGTTEGLFCYDPATHVLTPVNGLPSNQINHLWVDTSVTPAALYVATPAGVAILGH